MKKSTLITTIAMIVVVVVALSTATYAWFSSATTTFVSDSISTTAAANWIIMGGKQASAAGTDTVTYSSSTAIQLTMLDGLYSPEAAITGTLDSASNVAHFGLTKFYTAKQDGTGLADTAKADVPPSWDPITETSANVPSAANYIRVINTKSANQALFLTITVVTNGDTDSDFYAANGFSTYVTWKQGTAAAGHANTMYYHGTVAASSTGEGDGYYEATRVAKVDAYGITTPATIDDHNEQVRAGTNADVKKGYTAITSEAKLNVGEDELSSGYYYQFKIQISAEVATNAAVNIAFYAWFDGWSIDNTGANSNATVYYEFGEE